MFKAPKKPSWWNKTAAKVAIGVLCVIIVILACVFGIYYFVTKKPTLPFLTITVPGKKNDQLKDLKEYVGRYNEKIALNTKEKGKITEVRFFVIGDFGGHKKKPTKQYLSAIEQMSKKHKKNPVHAIINVGDNVYNDGLGPNDDALDTLFKQPFSKYGKGLQDIPVLSVLGNHDHCQDPVNQQKYSDKSIKEYLKADKAGKAESPAWIMPHFFWEAEFTFGENNHKVNFAMIDSMIIRGKDDNYGYYCKQFKQEAKERAKTKYPAIAAKQEEWIKEQSKKTSKDPNAYGIIVDHHPMHSFLKHGGCDNVKKFLEKNLWQPGNKKQLILSGHEHAFEYGEVTHKEIRQAIVGGTRECDGLTRTQKLRDWFASYFTGKAAKKSKQLKGDYREDYDQYMESVESGPGWRGCEYGGFAELIFTEMGQKMKAEIVFYSGKGKELKRKIIS